MEFIRTAVIRWSDLDPNFHLRHSMYYDICASIRMDLMIEMGISPALLLQHHIGPILFREECVFKREIRFGDEVNIHVRIAGMSRDFRKWSMCHEIWTNGNTLAATLTVDGAWMDTAARRIAVPPVMISEAFDSIPKTEGFAWYEQKGQ